MKDPRIAPFSASPRLDWGWGVQGELRAPWLGAGWGGVGNSLLWHPRRAEEEAREDKSVLPKTGGLAGAGGGVFRPAET